MTSKFKARPQVVDGRSPNQIAISKGMQAHWKKRKGNKYGARKTVVDGITFDSAHEAKRWQELKLLQRAGKISDLERQVKFVLAPSVKIEGEKRRRPALKFTADFRYREWYGDTIVEDSKGMPDTAFRIRQHLMKSVHGIDVRLS